jgi:hypothetical protein
MYMYICIYIYIYMYIYIYIYIYIKGLFRVCSLYSHMLDYSRNTALGHKTGQAMEHTDGVLLCDVLRASGAGQRRALHAERSRRHHVVAGWNVPRI